MFEVKTDGEIFFFETFEEIGKFFAECVWAVGAEDAEISVKLADKTLQD